MNALLAYLPHPTSTLGPALLLAIVGCRVIPKIMMMVVVGLLIFVVVRMAGDGVVAALLHGAVTPPQPTS